MPQPMPLSEMANATVFHLSKYSLITSTAGMKVLPRPKPIISEKVKNKYSTLVAKELRQKPNVAIKAPIIITRRLPCCLHKILPIKPEERKK